MNDCFSTTEWWIFVTLLDCSISLSVAIPIHVSYSNLLTLQTLCHRIQLNCLLAKRSFCIPAWLKAVLLSTTETNWWREKSLTHWGRGKMDAILQTVFSNPTSWRTVIEICFQVSNLQILVVYILSLCQTSDNELCQLVIVYFINEYIRHPRLVS